MLEHQPQTAAYRQPVAEALAALGTDARRGLNEEEAGSLQIYILCILRALAFRD
jgi:hypothetical protein